MSFPLLDPDALRETLESACRRCSPRRTAVHVLLAGSDHHPTAEKVYQGVKGSIPKITLATVYKALEALAAELTEGDGSARYDARGDHHYYYYYYFRDLKSDTAHDLTTPFAPDLIAKLDPALGNRLAAHGFRVTGYRLELVGYHDADTGSAAPDAVEE